MRSSFLSLLVLTCLAALVAAWVKEDYEIFRLRDELELHEGSDISFYDFLGVKPGASIKDINDAYRKKSRTMHPDKAKQSFVASRLQATPKAKAGKKATTHVNRQPSGREIKNAVKEATERFTRLGLVTNILRGPSRDRYDHFLSNGFPKWRGTGYYYARYRPGLFTTLFSLVLFGGGAVHYAILVLDYRQQRGFAERLIAKARKEAWGFESSAAGIPGVDAAGSTVPATAPSPAADAEDAVPLPRNRREKRMQEKENKKHRTSSVRRSGTSTPAEPATSAPVAGPKKRVVASNGKVLIVDSAGRVFLEEETEEGKTEEFLLDPDEIPRPSLGRTMIVRGPAWAYGSVRALIFGRPARKEEEEGEDTAEGSGPEGDETEGAGTKRVRRNAGAIAQKKRKINGRS